MLRFFEPEAEPRWLVSVAPPDHYTRMRDDAVLPLLASSIAGTNSVASQQLDGLNSYNGDFLDITSQECNSFLFESAPLNQTPGQASLTTTPMASRVPGLTSHQDLMKESKKPRKHMITGATMGRESKRYKSARSDNHQTPAIYPTIKAPVMTVKKSQKLGDKITALQQLVSPFGKTDTASVLQEACVYIKVLHEQIRVLSSPYFGPKISPGIQGSAGEKLPLRRRGLCLVPTSSSTIMSLTDHQELLNHRKSTRSITGWESTTGVRLH